MADLEDGPEPEENQPPEALVIDSGGLVENAAAGAVAGTLSATDPDAGDSVSYSLIDDAGGRFVVDPVTGQVTVATDAVIDFEQASHYVVRARATDALGLWVEADLNIQLVNQLESHSITLTEGNDSFSAISDDHWTIAALGGNDTITTLGGDDVVNGGAGADVIDTSDGADYIIGGAGNDQLYGGQGDDTFELAKGFGSDIIDGGDGFDSIVVVGGGLSLTWKNITSIEAVSGSALKIYGTSASETLDFSGVTLTGVSKIYAGAGDDVVIGSNGADVLEFSAGTDILTGGGGADVFDLDVISESKTGALADLITDFEQGLDKISLTQVDAATTLSGNQAFSFIGDTAFSGVARQLRFEHLTADTTAIYGDVNGDAVADFQINLATYVDLLASDFHL